MDDLMQFITANMSTLAGAGGGGFDARCPTAPKCFLSGDDRTPGPASVAGQVYCSGKHEDSSKDIVQQSQVSSTRSPSVLANDVIGPLLLEALDGFLFMVDQMGTIQFISENVTQYLKYTKEDLVGNNIYNLVHCDDYDHFAKSLDLLSRDSVSKSRTFSCRMNIKPPGEERDRFYDSMQITAILQPHPCDVESDKSSRCLLACIARRTGCVEKSSASLGIEKFTTKQDLKGNILACDTGSGQKSGNHSYSKLIGENVQDFCHANDRQQLLKHHREVISNGSNTSCVYRFRLHENRFIFVQTKSKLFKNPLNGSPEFIMSTHSIIRDCATESELKGSASSCLMKAIIGSSGSRTSKDQSRQDMTSRAPMPSLPLPLPQSTIFDLDDLLNDPQLDFDAFADSNSAAASLFADLLLSSSSSLKCTASMSSDHSPDTKGFFPGSSSCCPESPMSSVPSQRWTKKESRGPRQGRGRPRSSKKSVGGDSWASASSGIGANMASIQNDQFLPRSVEQTKGKCRQNFINSRSALSSQSQEPLSSKKPGLFGEISSIRQKCQNGFSGSSSSSSTLLVDKFAPNQKIGNKNAHLLDLLMRDDDDDDEEEEEEETGSYLCSPPVSHENTAVRRSTATSVKSEPSDSENTKGEKRESARRTRKPENQNAILKKLLSQVDEEDSQPLPCDLKPTPIDADVSQDRTNRLSQVTLADSSASQTNHLIDSSSASASNEAEPIPTDDALLKQLLNNKDDDSCLPSGSSSPDLLKSILSSDETFAKYGEVNSSETEVLPSGLSSPTSMEVPFSDQLNKFLSSGLKRKAPDMEEGSDCSSRPKHPNRRLSGTAEDAGGSSRGGGKGSGFAGPSKRNILLAQLLSKQVERDSTVFGDVKDLSAIATVTPLVRMLKQSGGGVVYGGGVKPDDEGCCGAKKEEEEAEGGKAESDSHGDAPAGFVTESTLIMESDTPLPGPKRKGGNDENTGDNSVRQPHRPLEPDNNTSWERVDGFDCMGGKRSVDPGERNGKTEGLQIDLPTDDLGSPSEEDRKILAELEEVLESSKLTMEDLNSIFVWSSGLALEPPPPVKVTTKSAINALEEQVSRIDSDLTPPQVAMYGGGGGQEAAGSTGRRRAAQHGWPNPNGTGGEVNELGLLGDFDELMATVSSGQKCLLLQGNEDQKRIPESSLTGNSLGQSNMFHLSSPAQHHDMMLRQQQVFSHGQLQVNTDLAQRPKVPADQCSEAHNGSHEVLYGEYTPISPATTQDGVFSTSDAFNFGPHLTPFSCPTTVHYSAAGVDHPCALGPGQSNCSPGPTQRCHSTQFDSQRGQFYGASMPPEVGGIGGERRRSGFAERFNPGFNPNANAPDSVYANPNRGNFDPMNRSCWNPMSASWDRGMMVDQRSDGQFKQTHLNLMNGSRMNELQKTASPFYGQGRHGFKGRVNQMNGSHVNPMNNGSMPRVNLSQMNLANMNRVNQINVGHINQLNFGQINSLNTGQFSQVSAGQMNTGHMNMGQTSMGPMNVGQVNIGQMSQGNVFMPNGSLSGEYPNRASRACHEMMEISAIENLQSRSTVSHRNQADFVLSNQPLDVDCSPMRGGRQKLSRTMNPSGTCFDSVGMLGYGESGFSQQMAFQGSVNHLGLNLNGQVNHHYAGGGLRQGTDSMNHAMVNGHQVNRASQANLSLQVNHAGQQACHGKVTAGSYGFNGSVMDQSGYGPSNLGHSMAIGQTGTGQPAAGQPYAGQPGMGQAKTGVGRSSPMDRPIRGQISQMEMAAPGFGSPPELSLEEVFDPKNAKISKQLGCGSVRGGGGGGKEKGGGGGREGAPSLFGGGGDGKMYGFRMPSDHHHMQQQQQQQQQTTNQQVNSQYSNCADAMLLSPVSNQSSIGMETGRMDKVTMQDNCAGFAGQISGRDSAKSLQRNPTEVGTPKETSTREYVKQELRNMCTARAQGQSLQQQQQQLHGFQLSPAQPPLLHGFFGDELPLDVLESINQMTNSQEPPTVTRSDHQTSYSCTAAAGQQSGDPMYFTDDGSQDPLAGDQFWNSLSNTELVEGRQETLSFEDILNSSNVLPKIPVSQIRMTGKAGSILQKLLSDAT